MCSIVPRAIPADRDECYALARGLIHHIARRTPFARRFPAEVPDVIQAATLEFLRCYDTFDGVHLSVFVAWQVGKAVAQAAKFLLRRPLSLDRLAVGEARGVSDALAELARHDPDPGAELDREHDARRVRAAVDRLRAADRERITRRFGLDGNPPATLKELAAGRVSRQRVDQLVFRTFDELARALNRRGPDVAP